MHGQSAGPSYTQQRDEEGWGRGGMEGQEQWPFYRLRYSQSQRHLPGRSCVCIYGRISTSAYSYISITIYEAVIRAQMKQEHAEQGCMGGVQRLSLMDVELLTLAMMLKCIAYQENGGRTGRGEGRAGDCQQGGGCGAFRIQSGDTVCPQKKKEASEAICLPHSVKTTRRAGSEEKTP
ncbi:unnamed protein product [Pleuronectes platessa]|uniref:Uncharacterized protein n=1 Tax=Pleuronectes platessa TaxID=8262 RepID=A0A9N7TXG0_PLEPL|nr:unnamed protein product [Pleuronectes platessa]